MVESSAFQWQHDRSYNSNSLGGIISMCAHNQNDINFAFSIDMNLISRAPSFSSETLAAAAAKKQQQRKLE